jgi:putative copper resistance protein D
LQRNFSVFLSLEVIQALTSAIMEMHNHEVSALTSWQLAPEILLPVILVGYLYLRFAVTSSRQTIFFFGGLLSIFAVVNTPVGARAIDYFSLHMVQHITMMMITGPLLVLGTPDTFHPNGKVFRAFTHPIFSWVSYASLMIGVHLPGPHNFIMENPWAHTYIEVPLYIALPYFFYFNLLDRNLINRRISPALSVISLFLMMVPETLTGFFIYVSRGSLYNEMYTLEDQRQGGSFMWSGAMIIDTIWMSFAVYHWIKSEERKSAEIDAEIAAEKGKSNG